MTKRTKLFSVHEKITSIFERILVSYEKKLDALDSVDYAEFDQELVGALQKAAEINPRMLTAVTKFLKDNDVTALDDTVSRVEELNDTLARLRGRRANVVPLRDVAVNE